MHTCLKRHVIIKLFKQHSLCRVSLFKLSRLTFSWVFVSHHSHLQLKTSYQLTTSCEMAPSIDSFFDKKIADRWGPTRNEVNALRELLRGNINHEEAATRFTSDIAASRSADVASGSLWGIWMLLQETAKKFPEHHVKLVKLVDAIRQLPDLVIKGETAVKWPELPKLAEVWGENVYDRDELAYSEEHIAVTAFTAQLCARQLVDANDFLSWAVRDFYAAFEQTPAEAADVKGDNVRLLNANVPIAAQWILHAGEVIYNCEESFNLESSDGLWTGKPGFSWGRWKLWKERAEWVSGLDRVVRQETIDIAKKMVEKMSQIESEDA
ncbi:hypothetical protein F5Y00DRAFT_249876 [Daldinia vernicosa]|uniref:uncharacterized protein n=1 Tax=Daldinia vernicosa TaxID=114800 RepID=UPI002008E906|nr:uncharacterized protein F5Y00DRAFT_249876 [Daldinia vernicosa]KAI0843922.1 hypothetical protein F5Y00DRAFT_249876 [Daldinia vernicosa]